ncbi:MAG: peptidoglycan-binding protein [Firmicutes bacterium]|nr:peptidoglycan-binding protein [Bacillota bacterium]
MMKGEDIKQLQMILNQFGANLEVDGYYSSSTRKAVMEFQKSSGLSTDGVVGPNTREEIKKGLGMEIDKFEIVITRNEETEKTTVGQINVEGEDIGYTLERAWKNNQNNESRIPAGEYEAFIRKAGTSKMLYNIALEKSIYLRKLECQLIL